MTGNRIKIFPGTKSNNGIAGITSTVPVDYFSRTEPSGHFLTVLILVAPPGHA